MKLPFKVALKASFFQPNTRFLIKNESQNLLHSFLSSLLYYVLVGRLVGGRYGTQYIYSFGTIVNEWMYVKNLLSHKSRTILRYRMEIYKKKTFFFFFLVLDVLEGWNINFYMTGWLII